MRRLAIAAVLAVGTLAAGCGGDSSLSIQNDSSYVIHEVNLSPTSSRSWGDNLLGASVLRPGEILEIGRIDCDRYDLRLVDEDGDECVLADFELCFDDEVWVLDDLTLAVCSAFSS